MDKNKNLGYFIAVIGGIGLGILIGSEFSGSNITIFGAILILISIVSIFILSYRENHCEKRKSKDVGDLTELSYDLRDQVKKKQK